MEHRPLGRTGVSVSKLCLGAMMFGAWGNPDHDESIRIIHAALDAGINFIDTADVYSRGESEEIVGKALAGGRRDDVILATKVHGAMGDDPNQRATRAAGSSARSRTRCAGWTPTGSTSTRSTAPTRHRHRGDARRAHRPRPPGQGPLHRPLHLPGEPDRRGAVGRARPATCSASSPSSRRTRCSSAAIEADVLPTCPRYGMGVMSYSPLAGGWLSGRWRKDTGQQDSSRAGRLPERFDLSQPANQRKLDAVEQLAQLAEEAGITLIELAIAFVLNHPAITAAHHRPAHHGAAREPARRPPTSSSTTACSTASTRSSRPARPSTRSTTRSTTRRSSRPRDGAERRRSAGSSTCSP